MLFSFESCKGLRLFSMTCACDATNLYTSTFPLLDYFILQPLITVILSFIEQSTLLSGFGHLATVPNPWDESLNWDKWSVDVIPVFWHYGQKFTFYVMGDELLLNFGAKFHKVSKLPWQPSVCLSANNNNNNIYLYRTNWTVQFSNAPYN